MNYKGIFVVMAILAFAVCTVLGIVFDVRDNQKMGIDLTVKHNSSVGEEQFVAEIQGNNPVNEKDRSDEPEQENEPITTETPASTEKMQIDTPTDKITQPEIFAELTIKTHKKTGKYTIMPDVNEKALMKNIGWLPSSSLPGEDGLCVLMGHRDTDFSILQYIKVGDEITIEYEVSSCVYTVTKVVIVDNDNELRFSVMSGSNLVLVTCYPFYYKGFAPNKLVVYSKINNVLKKFII